MKRNAIFLDRDGTLNKAIVYHGCPHPPTNLDELVIINDVASALDQLKQANFLLIGATNQPDVARGITKQSTVEIINETLITTLKLDAMFVCYHDDNNHCMCRKPLPGLLLEAAATHNIDLAQSIMIGDRWKDIEAGKNAGCKTIWLHTDYLEQDPPRSPDFIASSMAHATEWILKEYNKELI